jgi:AraC-like DNA-binding protein|tara:strand:+ start:125 stop:601 length:477 start_codon:yes stop_codon:yes gene_type:complete
MKTKNKNAVKKIGRPEIKITEELCKKAEVYAAQGLTMPQIASVLGMSETTLYDKKGKFTEFSEAIKRGKDKGIATITNALFNKARQGDNTSMIFYLKNQAGWQDRVEKETIIEQRHVLDLTRVSNNDLNTIERALESALIDESESRKDEKVFKRVYQE